jgi:hypothetical protein
LSPVSFQPLNTPADNLRRRQRQAGEEKSRCRAGLAAAGMGVSGRRRRSDERRSPKDSAGSAGFGGNGAAPPERKVMELPKP